MKINANHVASIIKQPYIKDGFIKMQYEIALQHPDDYPSSLGLPNLLMTNNELKDLVTEKFSSIFDQKNKPYLLKKSALAIADRIKIDKNFHPRIFDKFAIGFKGTIVVDENNLFLFWRDNKFIRGMHIIYEPSINEITYHSFNLVIDTGQYSDNYDEVKESVDKFVKLLIFIYFGEIETVELKPNEKFGTKLSGDRWKNESQTTFIIVDSTWNKTIISSGGFTVSGHLRLQPCGVGRLDRKLIYIEEFEKDGYSRTAPSKNIAGIQ